MNGFLRRLKALTIKEIRQISRDPSSIMIGIALPIILILIFGYGLSLDVKNAPVAVVMEKSTPLARDVLAGLNGSAYFSPRYAASMHEAEVMLKKREVDAIIRTGSDFDTASPRGDAEVQLILHGVDSTTATLIGQYVSALLSLHTQMSLDRQGKSAPQLAGVASVQSRMWFNEAADSTWYLVPGLIVIIMTLVGAFLTALIMAREWERGTLEALFVSPVGRAEILLLQRSFPTSCSAWPDFCLCLAAARWLFSVPHARKHDPVSALLLAVSHRGARHGTGHLLRDAQSFLSCQMRSW